MRTATEIDCVVALLVPQKKHCLHHHLELNIKTLFWLGERASIFFVFPSKNKSIYHTLPLWYSLCWYRHEICVIPPTYVIKTSSEKPVVDNEQFLKIETIHQTHHKTASQQFIKPSNELESGQTGNPHTWPSPSNPLWLRWEYVGTSAGYPTRRRNFHNKSKTFAIARKEGRANNMDRRDATYLSWNCGTRGKSSYTVYVELVVKQASLGI